MKFKGKDILLLILYVPGSTGAVCESLVGTTRLTKAFFIFEKEMKEKFTKDKIDELPEFIAWNYGPWSKQLIDDIEFFTNINFVKVEITRSSDDVSIAEPTEYKKLEEEIGQVFEDDAEEDIYAQKKYTLTDLGKRYVEAKIWPALSDEQKHLMQDFKNKINSISLFSLLRYVYRKYSKEGEDYTEKSLIKEKVM